MTPDRAPLAAQVRTLIAGLKPLIVFALLALAAMTGSRLLLALQYRSQIAAATTLGEILGRAWHFDVVVVSAVCAVVLIVEWLAPAAFLQSAAWRRVATAWLCGWLMVIVWNEAATPDFLAEFGVRPNRLYFEYLDRPREVFTTLWEAHAPALLVGIAVTALTGVIAWRLLRQERARVAPYALRLVALAPLVALAVLGVRGSAGHRPLNVSFAASSADPLVNDLALNSTYSAFHALASMLGARDTLRAYGNLPREEVLRRLYAGMQLPASAFTEPSRPSAHRLVPTAHPTAKPNLVILLQESLGAHYVASLGGNPVVQKIETWRDRSFWFDQLYASGTRSARGLEAVVTGFLPTRASSVLKLEGAQRDFFTLASALKAQGYRTEFVYGGDSSFDNMRRFFLGNGFDRVIDWSDMPEAKFRTTWGVADEDLYAHVHRDLEAQERSGQPFFTLVFSTSNHPPYAFPDGRITLYEQPKNTLNNAARYADYAVGTYLDTAQRSDYWKNTLFMVVADHESRTIGDGLVPVMSFHIPAFIAGGPVEPRVVTRIASQTDLVPTALSLMGIDAVVPAPGIDQSRADLVGPGQAVMQFHDHAAFRRGNDVVVLGPGARPRHFTLKGKSLVAAPQDPELEREALAYAQWPVMAYGSGWYKAEAGPGQVAEAQ
jgi:phosphoglycerol transferase MdoB-like AlkP superfamily enzyme